MTTQILAIRSSRLATWASIGFVPLWSSRIVFGALAREIQMRDAGGDVTGLFFLVPPVTALGPAPILDEWPRQTTLIAIVRGIDGQTAITARTAPR